MAQGKKDAALPVIKKAWGMAGCGEYDPKQDCAVLRLPSKDPGPSPMQIVHEVIASLGYQSPDIGVAPNHSIHHLTTHDGRRLDNVVGYPTWFWAVGATQADKQVTKSAHGMRVSLTIHPDSLTVAPGDGTTFVCRGMGTEWTSKIKPGTPSPTCGFSYEKTGTYSVRMTTSWTVHFVITGPGVDVAGDVPVQGWHQRQLVIGELQTVIDH